MEVFLLALPLGFGVAFAVNVNYALESARVRGLRKVAKVWIYSLTFPIWGLITGALLIGAIMGIADSFLGISGSEFGENFIYVGGIAATGAVASLFSALIIYDVTGAWFAGRGALTGGALWFIFVIAISPIVIIWSPDELLTSVLFIGAVVAWHVMVHKWLSRWSRFERAKKRHLCYICDYNLSGVPRSSPCPECGTQRSKNKNSDFF